MTATLNDEIPICCVCEAPTTSDVHDPALGEICYACRNLAAQAEIALQASGLTSQLSSQKNNTKTNL